MEDVNRYTQMARAQPEYFRNKVFLRAAASGTKIRIEDFLYFALHEDILLHWRGPPYLEPSQLLPIIDKLDSDICFRIVYAQPRAYDQPDIERFRRYVGEPTILRVDSWVFSAAPAFDPHLEVCQFLTEADTSSVRAFANDFNEGWFHHWDEVILSE